MRRFLLCTALLCVSAAFVQAGNSRIRDIDISVLLLRDGSATIEETWDVTVREGTEWYLVRENLGDIEISNLSVTDESGTVYTGVGEWDSSLSLEQKAFKCGLVHKYSGVEICWGLGSYGSHTYKVKYRMSNVVKSLSDYDMLHMQFISDGLSSAASHVKLTLQAPIDLSEENTRVWGFGFKGETSFEDGMVVAESTSRFSTSNSLILLLRLEKGFWRCSSVQNRSFQEALDYALEGADFGWKSLKERILDVLYALVVLLVPFLFVLIAILKKRKERRAILGAKPSEVTWFREAPLNGNIYPTYYILGRLGQLNGTSGLASAVVLRLIYQGFIGVSKDSRGRVELDFRNSKPIESVDEVSLKMYNFLKAAAGDDLVLQKNEFRKWATSNISSLSAWTSSGNLCGASTLRAQGLLNGTTFNSEGQKTAREALGFKKFLDDYTLISERSTPEVGLWQDYLVFGALFGIADKVASELKEINPDMFTQISSVCPPYDAVNVTNALREHIRSAEQIAAASSSRAAGGFGGHTSIGGGGGFSGGGHGGGVR